MTSHSWRFPSRQAAGLGCTRYRNDMTFRIGPLHGQRKNISDRESAARTLDSLICFGHGDAATAMEMTPRSPKGDAPDLYRKPLAGRWFQGNAWWRGALSPPISFLYLDNFATSPSCRVQTACRMNLF